MQVAPLTLRNGLRQCGTHPIKTLFSARFQQAAEKRIETVTSAFSRTPIQQVTSELWGKKRQKLLPWFFFQQPVKPCPDACVKLRIL
jgi:hypothetical protein